MSANIRVEQIIRIEMSAQEWGLDLTHREVASITDALNRKAEHLVNTPGLDYESISRDLYCYQARWAEAGATSAKALAAAEAMLTTALGSGDMNRPETRSPLPSAEHSPINP